MFRDVVRQYAPTGIRTAAVVKLTVAEKHILDSLVTLLDFGGKKYQCKMVGDIVGTTYSV